MIEVIYNTGKNKVTATGHAGTGPAGHDLVCASVSILMFALAEDVMQLAQADHRHIRSPKIKLDTPGDASVSVRAVHGSHAQNLVRIVFKSVCNGFALLAKNYPEAIKYTVL